MFKKRGKTKKFEGVFDSRGSFRWAIRHTKEMVEWSQTIEEKITVIHYVMNVIKNDIEADSLSRYLYYPPYLYKNESYTLFPTMYFSKKGEEIDLTSDGEREMVSLADSCIISYVSKLHSIWRFIVAFKQKFSYQKNGHYASYYREMDVCEVWHGLHSIGMGVYRKEGEIEAEVISLEKAFEHVNTDGTHWYNAHTGQVLMKVHDFRFAILYELAKLKHEMKNSV